MQKPKKKTSEREPDCKYQVNEREFWLYRFKVDRPSALAYELRQGIGRWRKQG
jgi:hypothetical protein